MRQLYTYFRSSCAYRVRIALNFKQLPYESKYINLRKAEQKSASYRAINPQALVPTLIDGQTTLTQSVAILEYLEERYPENPLLPTDAIARAKSRALALQMACDVHPLNNLRVLEYLTNTLGISEESKLAWYHHWIALELEAFEKNITGFAKLFCLGDNPTMADVCLIPQVYNALRYKCDVSAYPQIMRIYDHCLTLPAFFAASPEQQEDCVV